MKRQQRNTLILALALGLLLGGGLLVQRLFFSHSGPVALVRRGGEVLARLELSKDTELLVGDREGDYNLIQVQDGKVRVAEANCGDLTCVYTGWAQREGDVIACLPHGVIIYIEREGS